MMTTVVPHLFARAGVAAALSLALAGAAWADGYWRLDHVEFRNEAGADTWNGQGDMQIALTSHDNAHMSFREVWRGETSEAYSVDWSIPDVLRPGDVAPFQLSETCAQATLGQGWPFASIPMAPASLVADFNRDAYLQVDAPACRPDATIEAAPALTWKIPSGKPGDTTSVKVSAGPTYSSSVDVIWVFRWNEAASPTVDAGAGAGPNSATHGPVGSHVGAGTDHDRVSPRDHGPVSSWSVPLGNTGAEALGAPPEPVIWRNGADGGVWPGPTAPTVFQATAQVVITQIMTYHYGSRARPGTIALRAADGTVYGPWQAAGAGSAALPNAYWWVRPDVVLPPGVYTVIDSDPATWSVEAATHGAGIAQIWGRPG